MTQEADSFAVAEQTTEEPTSTDTPIPEMGLGINEIDEEVTPTAESAQSEEQPVDGGNKSDGDVDIATLSPEELKAGYLRTQDYTRKTQDLADRQRAFDQQQAQFIQQQSQMAEQQRQLAEQQRQLAELNQRIEQAPALQPTDPIEQMIAETMQRPVATIEEQQERDAAVQGLRMVDNLYQQRNQSVLQELETLKAQVQSFGQQAMSATERQAAEDKAAVSAEFAAADDALGAELVNTALDFVKRNYGVLGPNGEKLSVTDLVARFHNRTAEDRANGQQANQQQRQQAKRDVSPVGNNAQVQDGGGFLSEQEAIAQIQATF